ncbi:hypothetical protein ColLi_12411 [Colletotrichum liriopes]|uniref:Uncharacterized protein n=1 Tax=Colletotrichum liriopes TaxID=708192 RepID=A0AA37H0X7_9PEZI|nr:hypothetical protein ColLi_12411 [Colletotrichum liriopes]
MDSQRISPQSCVGYLRQQIKYNIHLTEWPEGGLRIDELWPIPEDLDEDEINKRRSRVDAWLEDLDEFGTMIYAVTSGTHGT